MNPQARSLTQKFEPSTGRVLRCLGGGQEDLRDLSLQGRHRQVEGQADCRGQGTDPGPWIPADRDALRSGGQAPRQLGQRLVGIKRCSKGAINTPVIVKQFANCCHPFASCPHGIPFSFSALRHLLEEFDF